VPTVPLYETALSSLVYKTQDTGHIGHYGQY